MLSGRGGRAGTGLRAPTAPGRDLPGLSGEPRAGLRAAGTAGQVPGGREVGRMVGDVGVPPAIGRR